MESGGEKVLFIEDNQDVALACTAMLESCGFEVLHVENAEAGLNAFLSRPFDLVLSDICLPGDMDGIALATAIRRAKPKTPIILATGYSDRADIAGRDFIVLRKPYGMAQFREAIRCATDEVTN